MEYQEVPNDSQYLVFHLKIFYTLIIEIYSYCCVSRKGKSKMYNYPRTRDYTTAATLILILYFVGWFPGFICNLMKLLIATWESDAYDYLEGFGCLVCLLLVCGFGPIAAFAFAYFALLHLY